MENPKVRIINSKNESLPFQRKVKLSSKEREKLAGELYKLYTSFNSNSSNFRSQLQRYMNNSEGISEPATLIPGGSTLFKPITETRHNIVHSFFMSTIRPRIGRLFNCFTDNVLDKAEVQTAHNIGAFFNNNRDFNRMYVQSLSEAYWATPRDGTVGRSCDWKKIVEKRWEVVKYNSIEQFLDKFPTVEISGMSEDSYRETLDKISKGEEVSLDEEFPYVSYDGPWIDTEEAKDIVVYPLNVSRQERTKFLGRKFWLRESELKAREKEGLYSNVDDVLKEKPSDDKDQISNLQDQIEGVNEPQEPLDYLLIHGRWYQDLDGDGIEEKYLVTFCPQTKTILQLDKYPFWHNQDFIRLEVFKRRPKRIWGRGLAQMLDDLNLEANAQSRFRIDSMALTNAPHIIADEALKGRVDPALPSNRIKPGGIWWLPSGWSKEKLPIALQFPKRSFGEMLRDEMFLQQNADSLIGASELRSGRETPFDPRSPAQKTAILLQQSATRMDDFIFDTIMGENEILEMVLRLYYQFGPDKVMAYVEDKEGFQQREIAREQFGKSSIHLQLSVTSLLDNPEYLRQQWEEIYMRYGQEPLIGNVLESRHEILSNVFKNRPETLGTKVLLPLQEIIGKMPKAPMAPPGAEGGSPAGVTAGSSGGAPSAS